MLSIILNWEEKKVKLWIKVNFFPLYSNMLKTWVRSESGSVSFWCQFGSGSGSASKGNSDSYPDRHKKRRRSTTLYRYMLSSLEAWGLLTAHLTKEAYGTFLRKLQNVFFFKTWRTLPKGLTARGVNWKNVQIFPLNRYHRISLCSLPCFKEMFVENTRQWIYLKMFKNSWYSLS